MAKDNNLTDFLTDVADAIREAEGGGATKINPQDFADRIRALGNAGDYSDCKIYFNSTKPASVYGGTWEELPQGTFLEAAGSGGSAGTFKSAGLPNIKGYSKLQWKDNTATGVLVNGESYYHGGAIYFSKNGESYHIPATQTVNNTNNFNVINFDASLSNSIYKDSVTTVQPKSQTVHIWRRIS